MTAWHQGTLQFSIEISNSNTAHQKGVWILKVLLVPGLEPDGDDVPGSEAANQVPQTRLMHLIPGMLPFSGFRDGPLDAAVITNFRTVLPHIQRCCAIQLYDAEG
jgi:hypothetical protein